jgi:probable rRNA maturation factor
MKKRSKKRPRPPAVAVRIDDPLWKAEPGAVALVRRAAALALKSAGAKGGATVLLTGDAEIAELNAYFRSKRGPTNVLSFPSAEPGYLGDIAIAHGVVAREARAQRKPFKDHAAHLAVHGVLHLLGHDHDEERAARAMETIEVRLLAQLRIADPYALRKAA